MVEMKCPECGHVLRIPDKYIGQAGGCKHCGGRFVVPAPDAVPTHLVENGDAESGSTALDEMRAELRQATPATDPPGGGVMASETQGAGCLYWGVVFHLPPIGMAWSLALPTGHPSKMPGMIWATVMLLIAALLVIPARSANQMTVAIGEEMTQQAQGVSTAAASPTGETAAQSPTPFQSMLQTGTMLLAMRDYSLRANADATAPGGRTLGKTEPFRCQGWRRVGDTMWYEIIPLLENPAEQAFYLAVDEVRRGTPAVANFIYENMAEHRYLHDYAAQYPGGVGGANAATPLSSQSSDAGLRAFRTKRTFDDIAASFGNDGLYLGGEQRDTGEASVYQWITTDGWAFVGSFDLATGNLMGFNCRAA